MEHFHYRNKCQIGHFFMNFHYARYENVEKSVPPKFKNEASDHLKWLHSGHNHISFEAFTNSTVNSRFKKDLKLGIFFGQQVFRFIRGHFYIT